MVLTGYTQFTGEVVKMKNIAYTALKGFLLAVMVVSLAGMDMAYGQRGHIEGRVIDSETGETLVGASVTVSGTAIGAATNEDGEYFLRNLDEGVQQLSIDYLGYHSKQIEVTIIAGETVSYIIELAPDIVEGEEVVVLSQAMAQARAIRQQLESSTMVNVVSESRLRELPDATAAESVGRLPGVSILRDAGEANKVAIRGLGPQYSSVTIDGDRITGTELDDRSVDMSMISPEMLAGIELYKVLRPDMDADAIGGTVNFSFSGAPTDAQYRLRLESGYHNQIDGIGTYKISGSGGNRFFNDRLGVLATVSSERVDRSSHVFSANYNIIRSALPGEPHAPIETSSVNLTDRQEIRHRHGLGLNLDLNIPGGRIYTNNFFGRTNRDEWRIQRSYDVSSNRQEWEHQDRDIHIDILNTSLGGEHAVRDELFSVDWRVSRNESARDRPFDNRVNFRERNALNRDIYEPGMSPDEVPATYYNDLDNTALQGLNHYNYESGERDYVASADVTTPIQIGRQVSGEIKLGGKYYNKNRFREARSKAALDYQLVPGYPTYAIIDHDDFPDDRADSGHPSIRPFMGEDPYSVLDGQYDMKYRFDRDKLNSPWDNSGDLYYHRTSTRMRDYDMTERVSAGYIMSELNIGDRLMVLPGVRYEYESSNYQAIRRDFVEVWAWGDDEWMKFNDRLEDVEAEVEEHMWFPMVQARYRVTDWFDVRLARTESTSRPSYNDRSPRRTINHNGRTVTRGNPELVSPKSINYDLLLTAHGNRLGLFTFGLFRKDISDVVFNRQTIAIEPEEMGLPSGTEGYRVYERMNNPNVTEVEGFEVEWQSNLTWLPSPFNGLVVNANFSKIHSEAKYPGFRTERTPEGTIVVDTFRVAPMVHQPDYIANASVGYDYRGFSARVSMLYQGSVLTSVSGTRPELDRFTEDYLRWDVALKQDFFDGLVSFTVDIQNLTDRRDYSTQFTEEYPRAMEYYGFIVNMGLRFQL